MEVLIRHQRCARRRGLLVGGREWLAGGKRGGAAAWRARISIGVGVSLRYRGKRGGATTAAAGGERQGASQHRDGRLQGGMVVLLLTHRQRWPTKGGLADWMLIAIVVVVVMASEPEVYIKLEGVLRCCVTTLSTLTR